MPARHLFTMSFLIIVCVISYCSAQAAIYPLTPGSDLVGQPISATAQAGDTLEKIGERYGVGLHEMLEANPSIALQTTLKGGEAVTVPTIYILPPFHQGIVVNLPELRLYYFTPNGKSVITYPVGLGRMAWGTPLTSTFVVKKEVEPTWHVPVSIKQYVLKTTGQQLPNEVPPGPDNPLGHFALYLGTAGYLIHGTNQPWSVGRFISSGCIRLHADDIEQLFKLVPIGTQVHIINYAYKAGWRDNKLYFEAQTPMDLDEPDSLLNEHSLEAVLNQAIQMQPAKINWDTVEKIAEQQTGIPETVGIAEQPAITNNTPNNNGTSSMTASSAPVTQAYLDASDLPAR